MPVRTALVCGATSGLGWASARALAEAGMNVVLVGRRAELLKERAASLPSALPVPADLSDPDTPDHVVGQAVERFGAVDVLLFNTGGPPPGTALDLTPEAAQAAYAQTTLPAIRLVRATLPGMRERGWGRLIAVGSIGVQQPIPGLAASNVVRPSLAGYLKTLAAEVAADGVTVNMALPGRIHTDRIDQLNENAARVSGRTVEETRKASMASIPVGRYGRPEEFAAAVAFLASEGASYVTGEQLRCDGGLVRSH